MSGKNLLEMLMVDHSIMLHATVDEMHHLLIILSIKVA
jgi:hypothetical protein